MTREGSGTAAASRANPHITVPRLPLRPAALSVRHLRPVGSLPRAHRFDRMVALAMQLFDV